jgi:hypothetical protein
MLATLDRLAREPPLRIFARALLGHLPVSIVTRARWELSARPEYLVGLVAAAQQAQRQQVSTISVLEFGVGRGAGLLTLQDEAEHLERESGVQVQVYGFDLGPATLPDFIGDHRDHPELWRPGDHAMDLGTLRSFLAPRTRLVLGTLAATVPAFVERHAPPPIGFIACDLDLYSSTRDALRLLSAPGTPMLWHVPMYFDDITPFAGNRFAGELLAVEEFNASNGRVKIDRWHGVAIDRPFPERGFLERMFVAHDLDALSTLALVRPIVESPRRGVGVG